MNIPDPIPMAKWGKDHWATLAYLETRIVDHGGIVKNEQMRCDPRLHARMAHLGSMFGGPYPTHLRNGETQDNHDDWSCIEDMISEGLVEMSDEWPPRFKLTARGQVAANTLRTWKGNGGSFSTFIMEKV